MSKLIIHIGSPKTGTTAIQDVLASTADYFEPYFQYPSLGRNKGGGQVGFRRTLLKNISEDDVLLREKYTKLFENVLDSDKNIIISSEQLWTVNPRRIYEVYPILKAFEVHIVVFLREQSSMIHSHYKQKIKSGLDVGSLNDFFNKFQHHYNYLDILNSWKENIKPKSIHSYIYEYEKKSLVEKFFSTVMEIFSISDDDIEKSRTFIVNKKSNTSMDSSLLLLFSMINSSEYTEDIKLKMRSFVLSNFPKNINNGLDFSFMSDSIDSSIKEYYLESNIILRDRYLNVSYSSIPMTIW